MRLHFLALAALIMSPILPLSAQEAVPDHRYIVTRDIDFVGTDLSQMFDTTRDACERACSAQDSCVAFTFNQRSNSCFPKSTITDQTAYQGAYSAVKIQTPPNVRAMAQNRREELAFLGSADIKRATDQARDLPKKFAVGGLQLQEVFAAMDAAAANGDRNSEERWTTIALAMTDETDQWLRLASMWLSKDEGRSSSQQRRANRSALAAATNAYLRAATKEQRINSLFLLANTLEANRRGRDMIDALRLGDNLFGQDIFTADLEHAIGKYGFRVVENNVESNAQEPRICVTFNEPLAKTGVDYDPFVRRTDPTLVVDVDGRQLCLGGVDHGNRYKFSLREGLPAASGEVLARDIDLQLYVRDRAPSASFPGRAFVLPRSQQAAIPVQTVNATALDLRLYRVSDRNLTRALRDNYFGRPLNYWEIEEFEATLAQEVWTGTGEISNELNKDVVTRLPLDEALADQPAGIYVLQAALPGKLTDEFPPASQWFVLSDLGLSTLSGVDGMYVDVLGLSDAKPRAGVKLSLISQANAVLAETQTDADGRAHFSAALSRGAGAASPALIVAEAGAEDMAFLPLTDPAFDLSDRGVEGHPASPSVDMFLTTDRGIYRAGETIFATALARDAQAKALNDLPVIAILNRPDGVEYSRTISRNGLAGGHVFELPLSREVPRGRWRLELFTDPNAAPLVSQTVLVEDFVPERIEFDLALPDGPVSLRGRTPLSVEARYLFGAIGADLAVDGEVTLKAVRHIDGYAGYQFGRYDERFYSRLNYFDFLRTDIEGRAVIPATLPAVKERPTSPLVAQYDVRVSEGSGRPVERQLTRAVKGDTPYIGIKPGFDAELAEGAEASFQLISVGGDVPARWTLNRVNTRYQWYQYEGRWRWEPIIRRTRIQTGELQLSETPTAVRVPTEWGNYELVVETLNPPFAASSTEFWSGWYSSGDSSDTPDRLEVSLDRADYTLGDTARLRIVAPEAGSLMLSVLSNRVIERRLVEASAGENLIPFEVTSDWGSGAYVTAKLIRPMDEGQGLNPTRSLGLAHAKVTPGDRQLGLDIAVADVVDGQAGTFTATVEVSGAAAGEQAYMTLAAVDLGILNVTGFKAPDPVDHYFGQRRLGVEMRDLYGRLIDGLNGAMGRVRSGGGAESEGGGGTTPPPLDEVMVYFSGPITIGPDGRATVEIEKPAYNGAIRLMAVAWTDKAVGNATTDVIARDPVVVTASLPRHLAPGDDSRLLLELIHTEGPAGQMDLSVEASGGLSLGAIPAQVTLAEQGTERLNLPLNADEIGNGLVKISLTTPDGKVLRQEMNLPVRNNEPEIARSVRFALDPGQKLNLVGSDLFEGFAQGTGHATLTAGPLAKFSVPALLQQLDRYPYGCTEQITSAAMPLLYLDKLASQAGVGAPEEIDEKIYSAIEQVVARQSANGDFGLWSAASYGDEWLNAYVTDFLLRARAEGYEVPQLALSQALDRLTNFINYAPDFDNGGTAEAYALLVLARAGAATLGDLRYYADEKEDNFATPLALGQLGAALAAYGDKERADRLFTRAYQKLAHTPLRRGRYVDFGSHLRDAAGLLKLTAEAGSAAQMTEPVVQMLRGNRHRLSTQEAAQVALAAHAVNLTGDVSLLVDGQPSSGPIVAQLTGGQSRDVTLENRGAPTDVIVTSYGIPDRPLQADGYGFNITRQYFTLEGQEVVGPVKTGTRLVVVLTVQPFEDRSARLILDDPLPGGFEIDNPNILSSSSVKALDWLKFSYVENAEFRSDRFIAAFDPRNEKPLTIGYIVRAVTPGTYAHPAALVEDMYRPQYRANTDSGSVIVQP